MAATVTVQRWSFAGTTRGSAGTLNLGTYATGGVSLRKADLGFGVSLESIQIQPSGGYQPEYDYTNDKIIVRGGPGIAAHTHTVAGHTHDIKVIGGQAAAGTQAAAVYGGDTLGKEQAANATIAGSASSTKGGVVSTSLTTDANTAGTVAALGEIPNATDLSAVSFKFEAKGL